MRYHYVATQPNGQLVEGDTDAAVPNDVLQWLASQSLKPVSVKLIVGKAKKGFGDILIGQTINLTDKVFLTKYLALMLKAGTDLFSAIDILIADFDKPVVKSFLVEVKENLSQGKPFYMTFEKHPNYFSAVITNLIKAGEKSGNLESVFGKISTSLETEQQLKDKIRTATTYPIILVVVAILVLTLLVVFVLPRIATVFSQTGIKPPLFSRVVFAIGMFTGSYAYIVIPAIIALMVFSWYFFLKNPLGKLTLARMSVRLPIIKDIIQRLAIQRFASTFSSLLRAGLPILESLEVSANAVGNEELKVALIHIAHEGIAKGMTVGEAFRREKYFPKVVTNLIAISEKAGHMEDVLETLAEFYASEVDTSVKILVSFLEPFLLLTLGAIIGVIALAVIIPIYQLVSTI